jgi:hypothetical protein
MQWEGPFDAEQFDAQAVTERMQQVVRLPGRRPGVNEADS